MQSVYISWTICSGLKLFTSEEQLHHHTTVWLEFERVGNPSDTSIWFFTRLTHRVWYFLKKLSQQALNSTEEKKRQSLIFPSDIFIGKIKVFRRGNHLATQREAKSLESFNVCFFHSSFFVSFLSTVRLSPPPPLLIYVIESSDSKLKQTSRIAKEETNAQWANCNKLNSCIKCCPCLLWKEHLQEVFVLYRCCIDLILSPQPSDLLSVFLLNSPNLISQVFIEWSDMQ